MDRQGYIHIDHILQSRQALVHSRGLTKKPLKTKFQSLLVKIQAAITENIDTVLASD